MLIAQEALERTRPDFIPRLNPWGVARFTLLTLCDGKRTLAEIERELYLRHQDLFQSPGEAAAFAAEVVTGYAL